MTLGGCRSGSRAGNAEISLSWELVGGMGILASCGLLWESDM